MLIFVEGVLPRNVWIGSNQCSCSCLAMVVPIPIIYFGDLPWYHRSAPRNKSLEHAVKKRVRRRASNVKRYDNASHLGVAERDATRRKPEMNQKPSN